MLISTSTQRVLTAILAGTFYGLALRTGFEWAQPLPFVEIISTAFLVVCPLSVGAIAVLWGAGTAHVSVRTQLGVSVAAMSLFLIAMFITLLEGLICLVLVAPVFYVAAMVGGLAAGWTHNRLRARTSTLSTFALLPLLMAPVDGLSPPQTHIQSVTNTIHIAATPEQVFARLAEVRDIRPDELGFSFVHSIGLPRPIQAAMDGSGPGAVRTSRWEKNVWFQEVITQWQAPSVMHWKFVIPRGAIPRDALDRHVEVGGDYFDLIDGGYEVAPNPAGGSTLSLTTRFVNKSRLQLYGNVWGRLVLQDFHRSILGLMKHRAEA